MNIPGADGKRALPIGPFACPVRLTGPAPADILDPENTLTREGSDMDKREIIGRILDKEFVMFHAVNGDGEKAACQNDRKTFDMMRYAQFDAWSEEACRSYLEDVEQAEREGRNICAEKYIHMMKSTDILQYERLKDLVRFPDERGRELAELIVGKMVRQTEALFQRYPYVSGAGRPLYSSQDLGGTTSIETYQRGELLTYSTRTLELLYKHLCSLEEQGIALAEKILEGSVCSYGYKSLEEAEAETRKRAEAMGIEISYGCPRCAEGDPGLEVV